MRDRTYKPITNQKKYQITQTEIDTIRANARAAKVLQENTFFTTYCAQAKQDILDLHAKQAVYDVVVTTEANGEKRSVTIPSKKEYAMLAGEYRFIDRLFGDLEQAIFTCQEMEEKLKDETLEVQAED
jgi:hypothetical protein